MKELIEKLELLKHKLINSEDFEFVGQFEIIQQAIQALTSVESGQVEENYGEKMREKVRKAKELIKGNSPSVKSESAEELSNSEILTWFKTQNFQEEQGEQEYTMIYKIDLPEIIRKFIKHYQAMHSFANAEEKQHAIRFVMYIDIYHNNRKDISYDDLYEQYIKDYNEYLTTLNNK